MTDYKYYLNITVWLHNTCRYIQIPKTMTKTINVELRVETFFQMPSFHCQVNKDWKDILRIVFFY